MVPNGINPENLPTLAGPEDDLRWFIEDHLLIITLVLATAFSAWFTFAFIGLSPWRVVNWPIFVLIPWAVYLHWDAKLHAKHPGFMKFVILYPMLVATVWNAQGLQFLPWAILALKTTIMWVAILAFVHLSKRYFRY